MNMKIGANRCLVGKKSIQICQFVTTAFMVLKHPDEMGGLVRDLHLPRYIQYQKPEGESTVSISGGEFNPQSHSTNRGWVERNKTYCLNLIVEGSIRYSYVTSSMMRLTMQSRSPRPRDTAFLFNRISSHLNSHTRLSHCLFETLNI